MLGGCGANRTRYPIVLTTRVEEKAEGLTRVPLARYRGDVTA